MKKSKKILASVASLAVIANVATGSLTNAASDKKADTSKFVDVNFLVLGNKPTNGQFEKVQAKWNAYLKKKLNCSLSFRWVEWADWTTKYNLTLASGEPLDLIITATDWLDAWPNAQKGAFKDISTLLPKYAPKTWASVSKTNWNECKLDGKIMFIPEDNYTQWVNHGFIYRGDWAKQFGITKPITNWEDFGKYLQGIKDHKKGVIPWDANGSNYNTYPFWADSKTQTVSIDSVPGAIFRGKSLKDPYSVTSPYYDKTFLDFAKTMKKWGDAGYWREDVLNFKGDAWLEMKAGKTGVRQHHTQTYVGVWNEMELAQPGADLKFFPFAAESRNLTSMSITHGATAVGANSKNPERALMVYDLIRNDKTMYNLINYGIEGVQYVLTKDGKRDLPKGYNVDKDNFYADFWGGRNDDLEIPSATIYPKYKEVYAEYNKYKKPYPYGRFVFDKAPVEAEIAAMTDVINQYLPAISFGKAGDPTKAVNDVRKALKSAGYDTVLKEVQKQMNAFKKKISK